MTTVPVLAHSLAITRICTSKHTPAVSESSTVDNSFSIAYERTLHRQTLDVEHAIEHELAYSISGRVKWFSR